MPKFDINQVKHDFDNNVLISRVTLGAVIDLAMRAAQSEEDATLFGNRYRSGVRPSAIPTPSDLAKDGA